MRQLTNLWWDFHFWFVKWFAMKPINLLHKMVNGSYGANKKWYHANYNGVTKYPKLLKLSYNLTKYVKFR